MYDEGDMYSLDDIDLMGGWSEISLHMLMHDEFWYYIFSCVPIWRKIGVEDSMEKSLFWASCCSDWWPLLARQTKHW